MVPPPAPSPAKPLLCEHVLKEPQALGREVETWPWASTALTSPSCLAKLLPSTHPYLKARSTGGKEIYNALNLLCFMIAVEFYNPDKPSMDTLDQLFSLSCLAKSMTTLPSWDGQQLPGLRATSTSPAFPESCQNDPPRLAAYSSRCRGLACHWLETFSAVLKAPGLLWIPQHAHMEQFRAIGIGILVGLSSESQLLRTNWHGVYKPLCSALGAVFASKFLVFHLVR